MTIASAIDDVIIAQGGTPDPTDTIADSLVNLAGVLAGENYPKDKTIEDAVTLLGEHIGGGGGKVYGAFKTIIVNDEGEPQSNTTLSILTEESIPRIGIWIADTLTNQTGEAQAAAGTVLSIEVGNEAVATMAIDDGEPRQLQKYHDEEWDMYFSCFTIPNECETVTINLVAE